MRTAAFLIGLSLHLVSGGPGQSKRREWMSRTRRDSDTTPLLSNAGSDESLSGKPLSPDMAMAAKNLEEISIVLNRAIDPIRKFTTVHDYVGYALEMIDEARRSNNKDGLRELESMPHEDLLTFIYGKDRAVEILVARGRPVIFIEAYGTPNIVRTNKDLSLWRDTIGQLRTFRKHLMRSGTGKLRELSVARPKYKKELLFLLGKEDTEQFLEKVRKTYKKWLMRTHASPTLAIRKRKSDEDRIYETMKEHIGVFRFPYTRLSYYELDYLSLVLGSERASELVIARARIVLRLFLGRTYGTDEEVLQACEETIADMNTHPRSAKMTKNNREYIKFLVGARFDQIL